MNTDCTDNRIRSLRLTTFDRLEIRWVREVGKFGLYLRYKDWLRRLWVFFIYYILLCII